MSAAAIERMKGCAMRSMTLGANGQSAYAKLQGQQHRSLTSALEKGGSIAAQALRRVVMVDGHVASFQVPCGILSVIQKTLATSYLLNHHKGNKTTQKASHECH